MWYRFAKRFETSLIEDVSEKCADIAEEYWKENVVGVTLIPNMYQHFAYKLTDELINSLKNHVNLNIHTATTITSGTKNAEHQIRSYAMLAFRETSIRNYVKTSEMRINHKLSDQAELNHLLLGIREDVKESILEIFRHIQAETDVPEEERTFKLISG